MTDWIDLLDFRVDSFIGVLPQEYEAPQPLEIALSLGLDLEEAGERDDLACTVDYAQVCAEVTFLAQAGHWRLLETLGLAILRHLLSAPADGEARARLERVRVGLRKPTILGGRAVPGVRMERSAAWCDPERWKIATGVRADVLVEAADVGAYRIDLQPGAAWDLGRPVEVRVLAGSVFTEAASMSVGDQGQWTGARALQAPSDKSATLLVVAAPPLALP
jgi:dihydroneopterin aldolase